MIPYQSIKIIVQTIKSRNTQSIKDEQVNHIHNFAFKTSEISVKQVLKFKNKKNTQWRQNEQKYA